LVAEQKILTWDILQQKGWEGPSLCILCKQSTEDINHLFLQCTFTKLVWERIKTIQKIKRNWEGITLSDCFNLWTKDKSISPTLATLTCWFIWIERNKAIFDNSSPSCSHCGYQDSQISQEAPIDSKTYSL
jgi:hypothetical protein